MSAEHPSHHEPTPGPATNGQPATADKGLPPVAPPSGRFIAQLFLVPGLIVVVLVLIWLVGNYLVAEKRTPEYFLSNLDSANEDIRWRAASDLAQVLKRPESLELASDPRFALELAERLQAALADLERREQDLAKDEKDEKKSTEELAKARSKLQPQQKYVLYLMSSLGGFTVPVGAPLLSRIATKEDDSTHHIMRRRQAVWALANLGENMKRYQKELAPDRQQKVIADLKEDRDKSGLRGDWARATYEYLAEKKPLGVDAALEQCAKSEDTFLRELVAMALNFWDGPRVLPTLQQLARDDGHGTRIKVSGEE